MTGVGRAGDAASKHAWSVAAGDTTPSRSWTAGIPVAVLFSFHRDWSPADKSLVLRETSVLVDALRHAGHTVSSHPVGSLRSASRSLDQLDADACVVLNWCESLPGDPHHGEAAVAALLDERGFTFTGSPAATLSLSAQKAGTKERLDTSGIPTPTGRIFRRADLDDWTHYPAIVKSAHEHSSATLSGRSVAHHRAQLRRILTTALAADGRGAIVEQFVTGREMNVTVWGNAEGEVDILPPVEVWMDGRRDAVYSYADKFAEQLGTTTTTRLVCPTRIGKRQLAVIRRVATAAYRLMGCRDYARVDGRLDGRTFTVLDINPNPDLCVHAESARAAKAAGISYGTFLSTIVRLAAMRHPRLRRLLPIGLAGLVASPN